MVCWEARTPPTERERNERRCWVGAAAAAAARRPIPQPSTSTKTSWPSLCQLSLGAAAGQVLVSSLSDALYQRRVPPHPAGHYRRDVLWDHFEMKPFGVCGDCAGLMVTVTNRTEPPPENRCAVAWHRDRCRSDEELLPKVKSHLKTSGAKRFSKFWPICFSLKFPPAVVGRFGLNFLGFGSFDQHGGDEARFVNLLLLNVYLYFKSWQTAARRTCSEAFLVYFFYFSHIKYLLGF